MRNQRRKPGEPFNPFAANANQVRRRRAKEGLHSQASERDDDSHSQSNNPDFDKSDFDKRDFLSPIRKAVKDGVLGREKNLELEKTAKKRNLEEIRDLMDYFIAKLSDIFGISEQITQKISNLPSERSSFDLTLSIHGLPEDDLILVNVLGEFNRKFDDDFYIRHFPDMDSEIAKGWMDQLFDMNNDVHYLLEKWQKNEQAINVSNVPEVGTNQFDEFVVRNFFAIFRESFARAGIDIMRLRTQPTYLVDHEVQAYRILESAPYKIRCRDVNDYTGSNCSTATGCTGECDYSLRCNWALNYWCDDCEEHGLDEECTNEVYDFEDRAPRVYIQAQLTQD